MRLPLFLIGPMGAGKSNVGRELATHLSLIFMDTDEAIETQTSTSVGELFEGYGELYFRNLERNLAFSMQTGSPMVVSTGGGFPCFNGVMDYLLTSGTVIYLKVPAEVAARRISNEKSNRPLLNTISNHEKMCKFLEEQIAEREEMYTRANYTVDANRSIEMIIAEILTLLK
jgi:shikimate kinase